MGEPDSTYLLPNSLSAIWLDWNLSKIKNCRMNELEIIREKLENVIAEFSLSNPTPETDIPGVMMARTVAPLKPTAYIYEPSLCICVRGYKKVLLGSETFYYDQNNYLLTCIGIPTIISIAKASTKIPYSAILLRLDLDMVRSIIAEMEISGAQVEHSEPAIAIRPLDASLLEAVYRLASLTKKKQDIPILAPMIQREILYRLLSGPSGDRLRHIAQFGSQTNRVNKAVTWIRENYKNKLSVDDLAEISNMGVSTFHRHFQELTTMSPIQYQKHLRLHEARRLMLSENADAATSAIEVGYESVTQFNREYRRLFGEPPATNKKKLLKSALTGLEPVV